MANKNNEAKKSLYTFQCTDLYLNVVTCYYFNYFAASLALFTTALNASG